MLPRSPQAHPLQPVDNAPRLGPGQNSIEGARLIRRASSRMSRLEELEKSPGRRRGEENQLPVTTANCPTLSPMVRPPSPPPTQQSAFSRRSQGQQARRLREQRDRQSQPPNTPNPHRLAPLNANGPSPPLTQQTAFSRPSQGQQARRLREQRDRHSQ